MTGLSTAVPARLILSFLSQDAIHVFFVGFYAGLAVGVHGEQSTFDHGSEHHELKELPQGVFVDLR